jgi:hypothetical protein
MTLVIATRNDMGRVTRRLAEHPEWRYRTLGGPNGEIIIVVDSASITG